MGSGQVQKWKEINLRPHILERDLQKEKLQLVNYMGMGCWLAAIWVALNIHCSWPESQRLSCPPYSPHQLFRERAKLQQPLALFPGTPPPAALQSKEPVGASLKLRSLLPPLLQMRNWNNSGAVTIYREMIKRGVLKLNERAEEIGRARPEQVWCHRK